MTLYPAYDASKETGGHVAAQCGLAASSADLPSGVSAQKTADYGARG
jgi:hypothetical protein